MPTVLFINGYRFHFFSNENNEPIHVHVEKGDASAKWWVDPVVEEFSYGFSSKERKEIRALMIEHKEAIIIRWNEHFR